MTPQCAGCLVVSQDTAIRFENYTVEGRNIEARNLYGKCIV